MNKAEILKRIDELRALVEGDKPVPAAPSDDPSSRWPYESRAPWCVALLNGGAKINRTNWPHWKRLSEEFGTGGVSLVMGEIPATMRWPDRVEDALTTRLREVATNEKPAYLKDALAVMARLGWEATRDKLGICLTSEPEMLEALHGNRALCEALTNG